MTTANLSLTANGFLVAGIMTAQPFGVSLENIGIGMGFAIVGVVGKGFVDVGMAIENGTQIKLGRSLALVGVGIVGSMFISTLYMAFLTAIHYPVDPFSAIVLAILGYVGPKGALSLVSFVQGVIPSRINPAASPGGINGAGK